MTVRKGDRKEGVLHVLDDAKNLSMYTIQTCKSEKIFPKNSRWIMANRIVNECLDAVGCIKRANAVPLDEENVKYRRAQQREAIARLECLLTYIDLAYGIYGIDQKKISYWTGLTIATIQRTRAWIKSDKERLKSNEQ